MIKKYNSNLKTMKHIICVLIFSLIFISSYTQPENMEVTNYLFPEFTQGVILMKDGTKYDYMLNYNSLTEEMIFENNGKKMAVSKSEQRLIDTVYIKGRKFVALNDRFLELIYHSKWDIYVEYKCDMNESGKPSGYGGSSRTTAIGTYSRIYSEGNVHELKLPDNYELEPYINYWIKKNGNLYSFANMRDLKKLYKHKKDLFKAYVKKYDVKYDNQKSIVQLIEYLEST